LIPARGADGNADPRVLCHSAGVSGFEYDGGDRESRIDRYVIITVIIERYCVSASRYAVAATSAVGSICRAPISRVVCISIGGANPTIVRRMRRCAKHHERDYKEKSVLECVK